VVAKCLTYYNSRNSVFCHTVYFQVREYLIRFSAEHFVFCLLSRTVKIKTYGCILLFIDLCGCKTWSFILGEKYRLGMSENGVLRKSFEQKRKNIKAVGGLCCEFGACSFLSLWDTLLASSRETCPARVLMNCYFLFLGTSAIMSLDLL